MTLLGPGAGITGLAVSREAIVSIPADRRSLRVVSRSGGGERSVALPLGPGELASSDLTWGVVDASVLLATTDARLLEVSLADGILVGEPVALPGVARILAQDARAGELYIGLPEPPRVEVVTWPGGQPLRTIAAAFPILAANDVGLMPRDTAPPAPWEDSDGDGIADWFAGRFRPGTVVGDVDGDGRATLLDAMLQGRTVETGGGELRLWDLDLDGAATLHDARLLENWATTAGAALPSPQTSR
jgi:hypothetical protein